MVRVSHLTESGAIIVTVWSRVLGFGIRVSVFGFRVPGFEIRVSSIALDGERGNNRHVAQIRQANQRVQDKAQTPKTGRFDFGIRASDFEFRFLVSGFGIRNSRLLDQQRGDNRHVTQIRLVDQRA